HAVMIEAVENHMPEVIVIDEIGTEAEAQAARTIAERGVQLIATAHGNSLDNLLRNPTLSDLLGGIHAVTLSDEEARRRGTQKTVRIYPYGVSKDRLMRAINDLQVSATIAKTPKDADVALTLKAHEKRQPKTLHDLEDHGLEVAIIRSNTVSQMKSFLMQTFGLQDQKNEEDEAMNEVTEAVDRVMSFGKPVELAPQSAHIRRLQHQLIEQHGLGSESRGEVPWTRVIVLPTRG